MAAMSPHVPTNGSDKGRKEISGWKARADRPIADVHVTVRTAHRDGARITVEPVYSGQLKGAPRPFAVPMTTLLDRDETRCRITSDEDHYAWPPSSPSPACPPTGPRPPPDGQRGARRAVVATPTGRGVVRPALSGTGQGPREGRRGVRHHQVPVHRFPRI
ncbi:hypothetical protein AB0D46_37535 [Streptomyces sp. NPDC048383]|uniref:hypothetical protein n=1 Tax=Streptomyces sp. NPDC048383 TaxID=3155386 RepID=UPI00341C1901